MKPAPIPRAAGDPTRDLGKMHQRDRSSVLTGGDPVRIAIAEVIAMLLPAVVVVLAFVLGLFVDQRYKLARIAVPPGVQIAGASLIMGVIGGSTAYFSDDVRSVPVLIGTAVRWGLVAPAIYLGNLVRDRVSPWDPPSAIEDDAADAGHAEDETSPEQPW